MILAKTRESALSVLPILLIVLFLTFTAAPVGTDLLLSFLLGAICMILGMGFFTLGAETAMTPIGERTGAALTRSKKLPLILGMSFLLGVAVTAAEPDLQVLAQTVPNIDTRVILITVSIGVGIFLAVCMLRIILGIRLRWLLLGFYAVVFILTVFADRNYISVAFDAGGVTTGPMTVPFILALGVGVAKIRSDTNAESDSFGLVSLSSIGPILAVLLLGFFYKSDPAAVLFTHLSWNDTAEMGRSYLSAALEYAGEMAAALSPIAVLFLIFQIAFFRLSVHDFSKIGVGIVSTYIGLVLFLTGVSVGFSSLGHVLGGELATGWTRPLLIPFAMALGWFIIEAEPAVYVLQRQIEEVSSGAIPAAAIKLSLSVAIAAAMGLSMLRVLTGLSVLWFLVPGYVIALGLMFFVPDMFTAIAFDSGGVASGPMTATFMLQFVMGVSAAVGGNILLDAFGLVAMVAMMPLISIQVLGVIFMRRESRLQAAAPEEPVYGDCDIIELWG